MSARLKSGLHNLLGRLWYRLGRLLRRTKRWDGTP